MTISPPLGVSGILVAAVIVTAWLAPPPSTDAVVAVTLPAAVHARLTRDIQGRTDADGQPLSVARALTAMATSAPPRP